jgi:AmmeMemoRadiSam system protein B
MNPRLRPVRSEPIVHGGQPGVAVRDALGLSDKTVFLPHPLAVLLSLMDGTRDLGSLRTGYQLRTGMILTSLTLERLLSELNEALMLDNDRSTEAHRAALDEFRSAPCRPPTMVGENSATERTELDELLRGYLEASQDLTLAPRLEVVGLVSPHIDFVRGGTTYAGVWSLVAPLVEDAELFIILGTDHKAIGPTITVTRQNYETPWGIVPTDQEVVDGLVGALGEQVFDHELNHRTEHSVEAALTWLHCIRQEKAFRVVPLLCGSFQAYIDRRQTPFRDSTIATTVNALRQIVAEQRAIVVVAADLAHMGPAFGDRYPLDAVMRARGAAQDQVLVDLMKRGDGEGFYQEVARDGDSRHICGLAPVYVALRALPGTRGQPTGYAQCPASVDGTSIVSICGMVLHRQPQSL